jgi:hypothetical protein
MKIAFLSLALSLTAITAGAQKTQQLADLNFGFGKGSVVISAGYHYNWNLGKKKKIFIGTGARLNQFGGKKLTYTSAPADLAGDDKKVDSVVLAKTGSSSLNLLINLGYNITPKIQLGFDIDAVGFSFGGKKDATFFGNNSAAITKAKPSGANILLIGNNDRGSLNSNFYARYAFTDKIAAKLAFQYYFSEVTTDTEVQTVPQKNDRFRYKSQGIAIGVAYIF